jgi:uncharacterized protein (UPF0332 family)
MDIRECLERDLLKKDVPDSRKAARSVAVARLRLSKAAKLISAEFFDEALVNAYAAMFHAGRALLFKDGFREKSHYGLYVYISEKYRDKLEPRFISELDSLRLERHAIMYSLESIGVSRKEAEDILGIAKDFVAALEKLL